MKKALPSALLFFIVFHASALQAQISSPGETGADAGVGRRNFNSALNDSLPIIAPKADELRDGGGDVIVIIGSSTAAGVGPAAIDSAWVWRFRRYVKSVDTNANVINLAVSGFSTYECMPTGFVPLPGRPGPRPNANITKALSYAPRAVVVNLPTNDASWNCPITETLHNLEVIASAARERNIPIWISTSQGRNLSRSGRELLAATRDSILSIYKDHAIDFWQGLAGNDGCILPHYDAGDGVHLNSDAHTVLCRRVIAAHVLSAGNVHSIISSGQLPDRMQAGAFVQKKNTMLLQK